MKSFLACVLALGSLSGLAAACSSSSSGSHAGPADASTAGDGSTASDGSPASDSSSPSDAGTVVEAAAIDAAGIVAARPYTLHVPAGYDASKPTPLVFMFHGYGASGDIEEAYMQIAGASDAHTFLYAYADGTLDQTASRFWNATNACCDLYDSGVDDVQYFDAMLDDVEAKYNVDRKRVFVIGHSNGGFMSHRLACDRTSAVAAIVSLAGAQWLDLSRCTPSGEVSVAEVHGNADTTIIYDGGSTSEGTYPGAPTTVTDWGSRNGCTGGLVATGQTLDIDSQLPGNETVVQAFQGCPAGVDVQLWTIQGGMHIPALSAPGWGELVWGFLSAHPKP
jgi:polyhydroxybutyrate depolymerase